MRDTDSRRDGELSAGLTDRSAHASTCKGEERERDRKKKQVYILFLITFTSQGFRDLHVRVRGHPSLSLYRRRETACKQINRCVFALGGRILCVRDVLSRMMSKC